MPSPAKAKETNSATELTGRIQQCANERHRLPNLVATDFTEVGDLYRTATKFNAATAVLAGVTAKVDLDLAQERLSGTLTTAELQDIADLRRLPLDDRAGGPRPHRPVRDHLPDPAIRNPRHADHHDINHLAVTSSSDLR